MQRTAIAFAFLACLFPALAPAEDLSPLMASDVWRGHHRGESSVKVHPKLMGDQPGIVFVGEPAKQKTTYASLQYRAIPGE